MCKALPIGTTHHPSPLSLQAARGSGHIELQGDPIKPRMAPGTLFDRDKNQGGLFAPRLDDFGSKNLQGLIIL